MDSESPAEIVAISSHVVRGAVEVNGQRLDGGDAAKIINETHVRLGNAREAEVLLFDLP